MSALPLYAIIAIAAGGGTICLVVAVTVVIVVHRRRKRRNRAVLDNLRMSLQTGSNVDVQQVRAYSPTKRRTISWGPTTSHRNKLQRSPTHARTLRQASSRDSIKPLIKHKKLRDSFWKPGISIVDTSELEIIEPASVYMPTGRPDKVPLTPISEKDTPESIHKSYRGVPRTSQGFGWNFGGPPRPLPVPKNQNRRSLSDSAAALNFLNAPQMPKSILKKSPSNRSISLQNQSPGPVPEQELPPTPKLPHATLPGPQRIVHPAPDYYTSPTARYSSQQTGQALTTDDTMLHPAMYNTPTAPAFLRTLGRNITPPDYEQWEINNLRNMDNSPAHSTKSSIRPPHMSHNSCQASVERSSLVRDKSSTLSLSLHDNWLTPSKPVANQQQEQQASDHTIDASFDFRQPSVFDHPQRQVLRETAGNSNRQSLSSGHSSQSISHRSLKDLQKSRTDLTQENVRQRTRANAPRLENYKRSSTQRTMVDSSRPASLARSTTTSKDRTFDLPSMDPDPEPKMAYKPIIENLPPSLRPPSAAEFNPSIEGIHPLYGVGLQRELENDPGFQNPNPEYSPLMSIYRDMMHDHEQEQLQNQLQTQQTTLTVEPPQPDRLSVSPLEPRKRDTMTTPPAPTRDTALASSPPDTPLKIDESQFPRPSTSSSSTSITRPAPQPNTSSLRKHPGRRRKQNRSPLRQSHRPSDSPEPQPKRSISRESLMKQNAHMMTTIMALRRQNSDVSTHDKPYFRLSGQEAGIGLDMLNRGVAFPKGFGALVNMPENDPFTDVGSRSRAVKLPVREKGESERGLSPTAKRIMAEERREQFERRRSRGEFGRAGSFGAIGEERRVKKARQQGRVREEEGKEGLSPGEMLTAAGAF